MICLQEFLGNSEHRAEDADALQQLSVTLKSQLTAETVRALSSNARVVVLDLHLAEIRAEVDKLTAQAAKLDEEQVPALCMLALKLEADCCTDCLSIAMLCCAVLCCAVLCRDDLVILTRL